MATKKTTAAKAAKSAPAKKKATPKQEIAAPQAPKTNASKGAAKGAKAKPGGPGKTPSPSPVDIEAIPFQLLVLDGLNEVPHAAGIEPPTYFATVLSQASSKRFIHVIQRDADKNLPVMLFFADRDAIGGRRRLQGDGGYSRALVHGTVHVLGADLPLLIQEIRLHLGGHEPGPQLAKPPYT